MLQTAEAYSPSVSTGEVVTSLIAFLVVYSALIAVDITLLAKYARTDPQAAVTPIEIEE